MKSNDIVEIGDHSDGVLQSIERHPAARGQYHFLFWKGATEEIRDV